MLHSHTKVQEKLKLGECCGLCGIALLVLAVLGSIAWFICACIYLSRETNEDIHRVCFQSNLWPAVLVWTVIVGLGLLGGKRAADKDRTESTVTVVIALAVEMGLTAWLGYELFAQCPRTQLAQWAVYKLGLSMFILQISIIAILCVIPCCVIFMEEESGANLPVTSEIYRAPKENDNSQPGSSV